MSDDNNENKKTPEEEAAAASLEAFDKGPSELDVLKERAAKYGITYSPNVKNPEILRQKIAEHLESLKPAQKDDEVVLTKAASNAEKRDAAAARHRKALPPIQELMELTKYELMDMPADLRTRAIRERQRHTGMRLVRCQIYNNNPSKNDLKGEILTFSNKYLGKVSKFIPFGEATENGYHVPHVLVELLRRRKYQKISLKKLPNGTEQVVQTLAPEYTINELPPLTREELNELAIRQAAAERVGL